MSQNPTTVLFVCSQARLRSPTAARLYKDHPRLEVRAAGTDRVGAETPLTQELIDWADLIVVFERSHRNKIWRRFKGTYQDPRIRCLNIPDEYAFMDEQLQGLIVARLRPILGAPSGPGDEGS